MATYVATVVGLAIWIVLWTFNVKALDGFLLVVAISLSAAVASMAAPYVREFLKP